VRRAVPILVILLVVTIPGIAWAGWITNGSGAGRAQGGTLPTGPTPSSTLITSSTITLTWSDVTVGGQPLSTLAGGRYVVSRNGGTSSTGCGGAIGIAATTCVESGLAPATSYSFTIAAKLGNWVGNAGTSIMRTTLSAPTVASTSPSSRGQGAASQTITVTGAGFVSGAAVSFSGTGIAVNSSSFASATQLSANVTISSGAPTGSRSVIVTNPDGGSGSCAACFTVNAAPTITFPTATAQEVVPHNQTTSFTVTGTGFQSGVVVSISGGFTVNSVAYVDASHVAVNVTALGGAFKGVYDLTVTNSDGGSRLSTGSVKNA
jgi:hypothetical protein